MSLCGVTTCTKFEHIDEDGVDPDRAGDADEVGRAAGVNLEPVEEPARGALAVAEVEIAYEGGSPLGCSGLPSVERCRKWSVRTRITSKT